MIGRVRIRLARWLAGTSPISDQELWGQVDDYICDRLIPSDPASEAAIQASDAAGLPQIAVSANQGRLLELFVRIQHAERVLELGTLGAYSTIWLARALPPGGKLVTLEADAHYAEVASANITAAGLAGVVELRVGPALQTLPELVRTEEPFDLIFIDADKANYPEYLKWSLKLSHIGTLIFIDNVIGGGAIIKLDSNDPWHEQGPHGVEAVRRLYDALGSESRLTATAIQTVGDKSHDGFALALVTS